MHNLIMDDVRNMNDADLYYVLGLIKISADSIRNFVDDPVERDELLIELHEQFKDVMDEFKRRQRVFDVKPS